jgi:DNA repair exonuclease SbcCD ATPase subunit/DNA repair exonuclease SbcCD nuclease subunit
MNAIPFIHLADIHFDAPNKDAALLSLREAIRVGRERAVKFWAIAGDLYNRGVANTEASGFPELVGAIQEMLEIGPVVAVEGTRTRHDLPGSYDVLTHLRARNRFILLDPGQTIVVDCGDAGKAFVMGCPEPTREWIVAQAENAADAQGKLAEHLRGIFLGLGAKRMEHPDMPAVMLYHGHVDGASIENQNLPSSGDLTIGREDLALCSADYYALGHIHNYQQIPGLPAWYIDSSYPVDWSERKKKHFNLVEFERDVSPDADEKYASGIGFIAKVEAMPFPHAPRRKIDVAWGDDLTPHLPVKDDLVWLSVRTPREHCTNEDREIVLQKLLANGALEGSRVTLVPIASEMVRAKEIAKKSHLREKLIIWAEANSETVGEEVLELADWLEQQAERSGLLPTSFQYHLRSVRVRGAKGIWKALREDEVFLDFDALDPGLVAFIGYNGEGKTTLAELCHPFSRMMTRAGTLQDHFRLRDSLKEVVYSNDATGIWYRARVEIDGKNKSGSAKYHLAQKHPDSGTWAPISDGTKDGYDFQIVQQLGSFELFTRTAFIPQRPTKSRPALHEATEGEKKELYRDLAGQDYLQEYSTQAGDQADTHEHLLQDDRDELAEIERKIADREGDKAQIPILTAELGRARATHSETEVEETLANATVESLEAKLKLQAVEEEKLRGIDERIGQITRDGQATRRTIESERKTVADAPAAEKALAAAETLRTSEAKENERILAASKERTRLQGEWTRTITAHQTHVAEIEGRASALRTQRATVEGDRKALRGQIDRLTEDLAIPLPPFDGTCFACGRPLADDMLQGAKDEYAERVAKRAKNEKALAVAKEQDRTAQLRLQSIDSDLKAIATEFAAAVSPTKPAALEEEISDREIKAIREKIAKLDPEGARKIVDSAKGSQAKIQAAEKTLADLSAEYKKRQAEREAIAKTIDAKLESCLADAKGTLETARKATKEAAAAVSGISARISGAQERLAELPELGTAKTTVEARILDAQVVISRWRLLQRACGPDGIQALELDAMAPGISEIANNLLQKAYGPRFSIEIRTTRSAGKGGKAHQVEDFAIWVLDADCPEIPEALLSNISGGEGVWISRAITAAFATEREQNHGVKFLTVIQDEGDSALDDDPRKNSRQKYFDMLEGEHGESGRIHTVVITHSPEAKDRIPQKLKMADLVVRAGEARGYSHPLPAGLTTIGGSVS